MQFFEVEHGGLSILPRVPVKDVDER